MIRVVRLLVFFEDVFCSSLTGALKMLDSNHCANCDRAIDREEQKFCPACGQPTPAHRIDWHFLGHELEHSVLHMDRGILYSLKHLMLRPGHLMRDYIEGRRARQVKPLMLLMIMAAAMVFLAKYFLEGDLVGSAMSAGAATGAGADRSLDGARVTNALAAVKNWMNANYAATTLILLPFEAMAFKLAFRRVGNLNYPEWLVIATFMTVQSFVIMAFAIPLQRTFPHVHGWGLWLVFVYSVFSLVQFFNAYPRWKAVLRSLIGFGIFMLTSAVLSFAAVAVLLAMPIGN
jgi:Protein of unknown function (DUF3667)